MALRDKKHLFTRRIAERGSDEIVFYSHDRKIQETDPKDVIWDEIIGKEEHPDDGDSYKFQETDSEFFIRDENYGKKEYLGSCSTLYPSPPCFDNYRDGKVSIEDFWWVAKALNVLAVQQGSIVQEKITRGSLECSYDILDDFVLGKKSKIDSVNAIVPLVVNGDAVAYDALEGKSYDWIAKTTTKSMVSSNIIGPHIVNDLNVCLIKEEITEKVSQYFTYKILDTIINEAGVDRCTKNIEYFAIMEYHQKSRVRAFGECMNVKVTIGCGMNNLFSLAYGGIIEKQVELFKQLIIFMSMIRSDIPYEPGGCSSNMCFQACGKTRGRVFSKRERMMQETRDPIQPRMRLI